MDIDQEKVDQAVLALLSLGRHEGYRTWKAFDWKEGLRESERLLYALSCR